MMRAGSCCAEIPIEAIIDNDLDSSLDVPSTESRDGDMEAVAAEPAQQQQAAVGVSRVQPPSAELQEEGAKKGYGQAYAAFGGGREGLEACAASKCS